MRRRRWLGFVGGVVSGGLPAWAQRRAGPLRIGYAIGSGRPDDWQSGSYAGFDEGMREFGYVSGRDYIVEWRFADGDFARFDDFAAEFARLKVDIIVAALSPAVPPLRRANPNTPIVISYSVDPVGQGLVASLARPGGMTTGLASALDEIVGKQVELLRFVTPALMRLALLVNPNNPVTANLVPAVGTATSQAGIGLLPIRAGTREELSAVLDGAALGEADAVLVAVDALFFTHRRLVVDRLNERRLPAMFGNSEYVSSGGLMSYGDSIREFVRRAATFVVKIDRGAIPAELPMELPTKFRFAINRRIAAALGLAIPVHVLMRADEVIE